MTWLYILIFIGSLFLLLSSGTLLVHSLTKIARFLGWKEFVVAFFVVAMAGSAPNFFVGINSAINGIPQLSFGDVVGGNIVDLTLAIALAVLITRTAIPVESKMVQTSTIFTSVVAVLPLLLIFDGKLGRGDGLILIGVFLFYVFWIFSKGDRFRQVYDGKDKEIIKGFKDFIKDLGKVIFSLILLMVAAEGIVRSSLFFAESFGLSLPIIGILIIGLGNALPEIYFAVASAKRGHTAMILGDLMGSIIVPATLVLGIVAFIHPIEVDNFSPFAIARIFLVLSAFLFFFAIKTGRKITTKEAIGLLFIYILFVVVEILVK
jgi:cation:H+ antiporter